MNDLWLAPDPLVLASGSKVRSAILQAAAIPHEINPARVDERQLEEDAARTDKDGEYRIAETLARAKAMEVSARFPGRVVLGADQTLTLGQQNFHKAANINDARRHLEQLSGKMHSLNAAIALVRDGGVLYETITHAHMHVRTLSDSFLDSYLQLCGDSILSSVGCYHVEGAGIHLFEKIDGDLFTIMGLPLLPLLAYMRESGLIRN